MIDETLTFSDELVAETSAQLLWAIPEVQLIAHTQFLAPVGEDGNVLLEPVPNADPGENLIEFAARSCYESYDRPNPATADIGDYLGHILDVKHLSVLEHAHVSFYITGVSRSLTHELVRHRHFSFSQLSQRYVGSADVRFVMPPAYSGKDAVAEAHRDYTARSAAFSRLEYEKNVREGMRRGLPRKKAREAARSVLPNCTETRIVLSGNYRSWIEFLVKRDNPAADAEIQRLAAMIGEQLETHAPNVFGPAARARWDTEAAQTPSKH